MSSSSATTPATKHVRGFIRNHDGLFRRLASSPTTRGEPPTFELNIRCNGATIGSSTALNTALKSGRRFTAALLFNNERVEFRAFLGFIDQTTASVDIGDQFKPKYADIYIGTIAQKRGRPLPAVDPSRYPQ